MQSENNTMGTALIHIQKRNNNMYENKTVGLTTRPCQIQVAKYMGGGVSERKLAGK